jgi:hypothetical protein
MGRRIRVAIMKLFAVIATIIFLAISGVATKTFYDNSQAQREEQAEKAIQAESYRAAIKTALVIRAETEKGYQVAGDNISIGQKIRLIDVSRCPPEFKTAWFDYLLVCSSTDLQYPALRACQRIAVQYGVWEPAVVPLF